MAGVCFEPYSLQSDGSYKKAGSLFCSAYDAAVVTGEVPVRIVNAAGWFIAKCLENQVWVAYEFNSPGPSRSARIQPDEYDSAVIRALHG